MPTLSKSELVIFMVGSLNKLFTTGATKNTVHDNIPALKNKEANRKLYRLLVKAFMEAKNHPSKPWVSTWMQLSVDDLANQIY